MSSHLKKILFISAAINALFIGIVLGMGSFYLMKDSVFYSSPFLSDNSQCGFNPPLLLLSGDRRTFLMNGLNPILKDLNTAHEYVVDSKKKAAETLKTEPFNEKAYLDLLHHLYDKNIQVKLRIDQRVAALAKNSTPQERSIIADVLLRPFPLVPISPLQNTPSR